MSVDTLAGVPTLPLECSKFATRYWGGFVMIAEFDSIENVQGAKSFQNYTFSKSTTLFVGGGGGGF
jgi:hypothetical protein